MKLEDCTKDELIHFIKSECFYDTDRLEFDVLMYRSRKSTETRQKEFKIADAALGEYIDLMRPYEGKRFIDIPDDVIKKASSAWELYKSHTKKSTAAQDQWGKIQKQIDKNLERRKSNG